MKGSYSSSVNYKQSKAIISIEISTVLPVLNAAYMGLWTFYIDDEAAGYLPFSVPRKDKEPL